MKSGNLLWLFIFSIVICSSCQKEASFTTTRAAGSNDSIYLEKVVELDTTLPTGLDTIFKTEFFYDGSKRILRLFETDFINNLSQKIFTEKKYYYNGADTLPFKTTEIVTDGPVVYYDTSFYTYRNGYVSRDSVILYRQNNLGLLATSTQAYSPRGTNVMVHIRFVDYNAGLPPQVFVDSGNVLISFSGENIASQSGPAGIVNEEFYQNTYDNKINPLYRVDIRYPVYGGYNGAIGSQPNNPLTEKIGASPGSLINHYVSNYSYRSDGLPLIKRTTDLLDPSFASKLFYFYTR